MLSNLELTYICLTLQSTVENQTQAGFQKDPQSAKQNHVSNLFQVKEENEKNNTDYTQLS